jgi:phosphoribosylglycinamide formyltransferase-1
VKRRTAILISGRGSNMEALIVAAYDPKFPAEIALVLSSHPNAAGLTIARTAGVCAVAIDHRAFGQNRPAHEAAINSALRLADIEIVCLAGYMRLFTPFLVRVWQGRMLNVHPSLLPSFPGIDTHSRALAAGVNFHGCSVHVVTEAIDIGPILTQATVPVLSNHNQNHLAQLVISQEHLIYPAVLAAFATALP